MTHYSSTWWLSVARCCVWLTTAVLGDCLLLGAVYDSLRLLCMTHCGCLYCQAASNTWDAGYCDRWSRRLSCHVDELCKNDWTDQRPFFAGDSWDPRIIVSDRGAHPPRWGGREFDVDFVKLLWWLVLLQTDAERNRNTVVQLPVDSDLLTVILDYVYTDSVPQLSANGRPVL